MMIRRPAKKAKILLKDVSIICVITLILFLIADFFISTFAKQFLLDKFGESAITRTTNLYYDHDLKKNVDLDVSWGNKFLYRLCTNRFGFKDNCKNVNKTINKHFDVAFIGDSMVEGVGLPYEDTMAGMYAAKHPNLKVANLGVVSYSPSIYFMKIKWLLDNGFSFGRVVILPDISDIQDEGVNYKLNGKIVSRKNSDGSLTPYRQVMFNHIKNQIKPYFILSFNLERISKVAHPPHQLRYQNDFYLPTGDSRINRFSYAQSELFRSEWPYNENSEHYGISGVKGATNQAIDSMNMLVSLLKSKKIPFDFVVYPWPTLLLDENNSYLGSSIWRSFCETNGCAKFVDVGQELAKEIALTNASDVISKYYFFGDIHFNRFGNYLLYSLYDKTMHDKSGNSPLYAIKK